MGLDNGTAPLESSLAVPQKVKYRITIWPSRSVPRRNENTHPVNPCESFLALDYSGHQSQSPKGGNSPTSRHRTDQPGVAYPHRECYSATTRTDVLMQVTTGVSPEHISPSGRSQMQRTHTLNYVSHMKARKSEFLAAWARGTRHRRRESERGRVQGCCWFLDLFF